MQLKLFKPIISAQANYFFVWPSFLSYRKENNENNSFNTSCKKLN